MITKYTIALGLLLVYMILYPFISDGMWTQSLEDIRFIQEGTDALDMMKVVEYLSRDEMLYGLIVLAFNFIPKMNALYLWCTTSILMHFQGYLQMIYQSPRPYWASEEITSFRICGESFGGPSRQMMLSSFVLLSLYLDKYHDVGERTPKFKGVMCTGYIIKMGVTTFLGVYLFILAYALMFIGFNSYDQIIFGGVLGIALGLILHFKVKLHFKLAPVYLSFEQNAKMQNMSEWYDNIVSKEVILNENRYFVKPNHWVICLAALILLVDAVSAISYTVASKNASPRKYLEQIKGSCAPQYIREDFSIFGAAWLDQSRIALFQGAVLGQLFEMKFVQPNISNLDWNKTYSVPRIVRCLITMCLIFLAFSPQHLLEHTVSMNSQFYFERYLPQFIIAFVFFGLLRSFFEKINLINKGAKGQEFNELTLIVDKLKEESLSDLDDEEQNWPPENPEDFDSIQRGQARRNKKRNTFGRHSVYGADGPQEDALNQRDFKSDASLELAGLR